MTEYSMEQIEREIQDLWLRRNRLTEAEHAILYRLVSSYLRRLDLKGHYSAIRRCERGLGWQELKSQLIDDFYCDVIYRRALKEGFEANPLAHLGALAQFYTRWLVDHIRRCITLLSHEELVGSDNKAFADEAAGGFQDEPGELSGDTVSLQAIEGFIRDNPFQRTDMPEGTDSALDEMGASTGALRWTEPTEWDEDLRITDGPAWGNSFPVAQATSVADGPSLGKIQKAACNFLDWAERRHAEAGEAPWILLYLGCHHCPPDPENSLPMSALRQRYRIPDYHNRARRLGITSALGGFPSLRDFAKTLLGQWIRGLGFRIDRSEQSQIGEALKILCEEALIRVQTKRLC